MQPKTPNRIQIHAGKANLTVTGMTRHQIVWFHYPTKSYIRALMDGRIMEVIPPDESFSEACNWVLEADINDDERAYTEQQQLKADVIKNHFFPLCVWKQAQLQIAETERIKLEETVIRETKNIAYQAEQSGFDFSFLDTFR